MDPLTAEKIVNVYGKVLEQVSHMSFGAPESLLPYKKEIIKEAIKVTLDILEPEEQEIGENLRVGYMELARFIPDKEAEIASKGQNILMSCSPNASKEEILEYLKRNTTPENSKYIDLALKISEKISIEQKTLLEEIRNYCEAMKKKPILSKIIAYKNDKYRCFCQIKLNSGERILISIAGTPTPSIKVSKLALWGFIPIQTIWEYNPKMASGYEAYARNIFYMFGNPESQKHPLDAIIDALMLCDSIEEVRLTLLKTERLSNLITSEG